MPSTAIVSPSHQLRRYSWRALLGILGPLALLGFYAYICFYFLNRQPEYDILPSSKNDAIVPFYAWFVISIFSLDWARTGLANFEAAALMSHRISPSNALDLFWHADNNWANPLWWLRALRNGFCRLIWRTPRTKAQGAYRSTPKLLWTVLSLISLLVFIAIPLSGLTMELNTLETIGERHASILGPGPINFNAGATYDLPSLIDGVWRAGGNATPSDASHFFAPEGTRNVSLSYFEDMAREARPVTSFLGPAVNDQVSGNAFGLETAIHCGQVASRDLRLIMVHKPSDYNITAITRFGSYGRETALDPKFEMIFTNESKEAWLYPSYDFGIAADGPLLASPYDSFDGLLENGPSRTSNMSTDPFGYLELFLWQGELRDSATPAYDWDPAVDDQVLQNLLDSDSPLVEKTTFGGNRYAGFAIQCTVRAAAGYADIDSATRNYRNFRKTRVTEEGGALDYVSAPQTLAALTFRRYTESTGDVDPSEPESDYTSGLVALQQGIGQAARQMEMSDYGATDPDNSSHYLSMTPENVTYSLYRLLGHSIIIPMGARSQDPWEGDLFLLEPARWLRPGPVPWQLVLALLTAWTIAIVSLSVWTLFRKRWAPTLNGFELFRFGAQYTDEVNEFDAHRFEACEPLKRIPGMVGVMHGSLTAAKEGFIGLSEIVADQNGNYVYDRRLAAAHRAP